MDTSDKKKRLTGLELNKFRISRILLLSTPYDGFVLEEDGGLYEQIYHHFSDLSIPFIPQFTRVSDLKEALEELKAKEYSLIITMFRHNDINTFYVEKKLKEQCPDVSIVMLSYERLTDKVIAQIRVSSYIDKIFYWAGNSKLLFAIVKHIEDCKNTETDCKLGVQVILVVEDSPGYYSQILPVLYTEILRQTRYLVQHAMNATHGLQRVRMRPKILLAENYESAIEIIDKYNKNLLGVISDVRFPKNGKVCADAGFELAKYTCGMIRGVNFMLQSWEIKNKEQAKEKDIMFLDKNSPNLLQELKEYVIQYYGFGSFIFRYPNGEKITEAADVTELERVIRSLPGESLYYHASHNHFSTWFRARTEFEIAEKLLRANTDDNPPVEAIRTRILARINEYFSFYQSGVILDFAGIAKKNLENTFIKIGSGSLGGKARGIAFINSLMRDVNLPDKYPNVEIKVPRSFVICSDAFSEFTDKNAIYDFIAGNIDERAIAAYFKEQKLPETTEQNLAILIENANFPLVVRSSSILEDSRILPFAGSLSHPSWK